MSNPNPSARPAPVPRSFVGVAFVFLAACRISLASYATTVAGGSDSSGYLNRARLLPSGNLTADLCVHHPETTSAGSRPGIMSPLRATPLMR